MPGQTIPPLPQRLRTLADWMEDHDVEGTIDHNVVTDQLKLRDYSVHTAEGIARVVRRIGGRWSKRVDDIGLLFFACREVAPGVAYELVANREDVCTRVVTGTREVTVEEPDPEQVAALPKITRTQVVEDIEWRCGPLLADREQVA